MVILTQNQECLAEIDFAEIQKQDKIINEQTIRTYKIIGRTYMNIKAEILLAEYKDINTAKIQLKNITSNYYTMQQDTNIQ